MSFDQSEIRTKLINALKKLYERDLVLFHVDANERSITHKLAEYLQAEFSEWHVDCEYNKIADDQAVKRLPWNESSKHKDGSQVYPDIIVHQRTLQNNLLVIEVKKEGVSGDDDLVKLKYFASHEKFNYKNAIFLELGKSYIEAHEFSSIKNDLEKNISGEYQKALSGLTCQSAAERVRT